jgi:hypothetical protein
MLQAGFSGKIPLNASILFSISVSGTGIAVLLEN